MKECITMSSAAIPESAGEEGSALLPSSAQHAPSWAVSTEHCKLLTQQLPPFLFYVTWPREFD